MTDDRADSDQAGLAPPGPGSRSTPARSARSKRPSSPSYSSPPSTPTGADERITLLDLLRGAAVLGILGMNAVAFGLPDAAYTNLDATPNGPIDWLVGGFGELVFDQKMMALFSALFGAGIVLFADRAADRAKRPWLLSLWRNSLLAGIGVAHSLLWEGDILVVYAACAPILIATRRWPPRVLFTLGGGSVVLSALLHVWAQSRVSDDGHELGEWWFVDGRDMSDEVGLVVLADFGLRAIGLMWIGVGLYRVGILQGKWPPERYRRLAIIGLGVGLPLALAGIVVQAVGAYRPSVAMIGQVPNTLGTIPAALGMLGLVAMWDRGPATAFKQRLEACGRMALTNYLTQTMLGLIVLGQIFGRGALSRSQVAIFVVAVWVLQLGWSKPWLDRFRFGPFEWLWRCATYRRWQPIRR